MSEPRDESSPAGSIDERVDAILREMVAGEGSLDVRARVMAAIASGQRRERGSRGFPWPGVALVASVLIAAIVLVGRDHLREPSPQTLSTAAQTARNSAPTQDAKIQGPALAARIPAPVSVRRRPSLARATDGAPQDFLPSLEIPPIGGTSPLVLPPIRTAGIDATELTLPALEINPLPAEPPLSGSY
jgi:hypothetical protein